MLHDRIVSTSNFGFFLLYFYLYLYCCSLLVDLDRCTNGKSVEILEAVHILFHETRPEDSAYFGRRFLIHSIWWLWWRRMCYWLNWCCCIAVPSWLCCCWTRNAPTWSQPPQPMQGEFTIKTRETPQFITSVVLAEAVAVVNVYVVC